MGPVARVVPGAFETVEPGYLRQLRRRQTSRRHDAELRADGFAHVGGDGPALRVVVEDRRGDPRLELDVAPEVEPVGDVVDVAKDLRLRRVTLTPLPFLLEVL